MQLQMNKEQKKQVREIFLELERNEVFQQLLNFISKNEPEYHWHRDDVILFVDFLLGSEFYAVFGNAYQENPLQVTFCNGYFAVEMKQIAERFEFDLEFLFEPKNE